MTEYPETLTLKTKIGYAFGDFGGNIVFQSVSLFVVFYFTEVFGLTAAAAGAIFAIAKLWNAICDPVIGALTDRVRTRWGQKRPFFLFGAIPLGLSFFLLMAAPAIEAKFGYALITFLFFSSAYSLVGVPYGALTASITSSPSERSKLTAYRMAFAIFATLLVGGLTKPIVGAFATPQEGFRAVGALYGIAVAICTWIAFATTYERQQSAAEKSGGMREAFSILIGNRPFLLLAGSIIVHFAAITVTATLVNYYFKYNLKAEAVTPVAFVCMFLSAAAALPMWLKVDARIGKAKAFNAGMLLLATALAGLFVFEKPSAWQVIPFMVMAGIGMSTIYIFPWSMIPSTVDYSEWKTGIRREGLLYGVFYFSFKASAALGGLIAGLGLDWAGYVASPENIQSSTQGPATLVGFRWLMTLVPIGLILIGVALIRLYPIDVAMEKEMLRDAEVHIHQGREAQIRRLLTEGG
jgi:GPH family glycoside/pentoside/hexuronide:cation symporter